MCPIKITADKKSYSVNYHGIMGGTNMNRTEYYGISYLPKSLAFLNKVGGRSLVK